MKTMRAVTTRRAPKIHATWPTGMEMVRDKMRFSGLVYPLMFPTLISFSLCGGGGGGQYALMCKFWNYNRAALGSCAPSTRREAGR